MQEVTVGFETTVYTTSERQGLVEINIVVYSPLIGGTPSEFSLLVTVENSTAGMKANNFTTERSNFLYTAVSPTDFGVGSDQIIQFNIGDTRNSVTLPITDDELCETPNEMFFVNIALTSQTPRTTVSPSRAVVIINDMNEPECGEFN